MSVAELLYAMPILQPIQKLVSLRAREEGAVLRYITLETHSSSRRTGTASYQNPEGLPPRDLPKTHSRWVKYYVNLDKISQASGINLNNIRNGDTNGQPHLIGKTKMRAVVETMNFYITLAGVLRLQAMAFCRLVVLTAVANFID